MFIKIQHANKLETWYSGYKEAYVSEKQEVKKGEELGIIGVTGSGPHLHFSILLDGRFMNPLNYIEVE